MVTEEALKESAATQPTAIFKKLDDGRVEVGCAHCGALLLTVKDIHTMLYSAGIVLNHVCKSQV